MKNLIVIQNEDEDIEIEYSISVEETKLLLTSGKNENYSNYDMDINEIEYFHFKSGISEYEKTNYTIAGASGLLTGLLNILWSKDFKLEDAQNWGKDKVEKFVINIAKIQGYRKNELTGAIKFLEEKFPIAADKLTNEFGGGYSHHLRDFSHHPTILGLISSILNQFGIGIGTNTNGEFVNYKIKDTTYVGRTFEEKIFNGFVMWAFHLISDMAGSSSNPGKGTGIPGILLSTFKEFSTLPIIKDIKSNYKDEDVQISIIISKLFNGTYFKDKNGNPIRLDLRTEIGVLAQQSKSVLINECIVRALYFIRSLYKEITTKNIKSLKDLNKIEIKNILSFNSRDLKRMLTISNGVFVLVDLSKALIKSGGTDVTKFILNINYVGIGRFAFACKADACYIEEDLRKTINNYIYQQKENYKPYFDFKMLSLSGKQKQILESLKLKCVEYDISKTKNDKEKKIKESWLKSWKNYIFCETNDKKYFIENSDEIYKQINQIEKEHWIYIILIELYLFKPYFQLKEDEILEKKIKLNNDYFNDIFTKQQKVFSNDEIKNIIKDYKNYYNNVLQSKNNKTIIGISTTLVVTAATGGAGWFFAPQIATFIAGETVAGLSGAALTSASLAFVGGGSLAVGGLGMAGGTAILSGGGALIGLASSGVTSLAYTTTNMSNKFILQECAKLLTFCKVWIIDNKQDKKSIIKIKESIEDLIEKFNINLAKEKDKKIIKQIKNNIKYLERSVKALDNLK